ncbi:hypothetical protein NQK81_00630 [Amycolatopsis roodepoortensis]|uniref:hypothetical protein n=1 Tax=Amycolatopsis roodepoortensis TaxID=700274 RepID=UPI00214C87B9|nr:hypothetical protein [Amycolatopsis roodepoortensis]UUV31985.1 hypothetical protein NQK81_00630 [Amycolatopsis roodepoortensis]
MSDVDLAVGLLRATPTHENRSDGQLRTWAEIALAYGDELAEGDDSGDVQVVEREGGVSDGELVLAEHQRGSVVVYTDALRRVEKLARARGWPITREALRRAAVAHELAHHRLDVRELNRRLGHTAFRLGPLRLRGHVAGAEEITAHRFAHHRSGLAVSPLLITTALAGGN